jgi:hypothetical protein
VRGALVVDVSELPVDPIFTGQTNKNNQRSTATRIAILLQPVKMGTTGSSETSTTNSRRTSCNYPKTKKQLLQLLESVTIHVFLSITYYLYVYDDFVYVKFIGCR